MLKKIDVNDTTRAQVLADASIDLKTKGVILFISHMPEGADMSFDAICEASADGISSIRSAVAKAEEAGYIKRSRVRRPNGSLGGAEWVLNLGNDRSAD